MQYKYKHECNLLHATKNTPPSNKNNSLRATQTPPPNNNTTLQATNTTQTQNKCNKKHLLT